MYFLLGFIVYPRLLQYFNCWALTVSQQIAPSVVESFPARAIPQENNLILNKPKKGFLLFLIVLRNSCSQCVIPRILSSSMLLEHLPHNQSSLLCPYHLLLLLPS